MMLIQVDTTGGQLKSYYGFYDFFIKQVRKSDIETMYNHHYFMCMCICICILSVYIAIAILLVSRLVSSFSLLGIGSN